jgi:predicted CopG family antitoxin
MASRKIKVVYRKLGKEKAWGQCLDDCIEIDERLIGKKHLEILTHESLHFLFPEASEEEVTKKAIILTNTIWGQMYRRIDNQNSQPLQDGKR